MTNNETDITKDTNDIRKKRKCRNDILLLCTLLALSLAALLLFMLLSTDGRSAAVYIDGELYGSYPLSEDITVEIPSADGGRNLLAIENGKARVTEASCPDLICASESAKSAVGESIICLPNKVVIAIE